MRINKKNSFYTQIVYSFFHKFVAFNEVSYFLMTKLGIFPPFDKSFQTKVYSKVNKGGKIPRSQKKAHKK